MATIRELYDTLDLRVRPEDVAQMALDLLGNRVQGNDRALLQRAARRSIRHSVNSYTSMCEDFARPVAPERPLKVATEIFKTAKGRNRFSVTDPDSIERFLKQISNEVRKTFGRNDFKNDRLNTKQRKKAGLDISRRRYNKLFRHLARLEEKLTSYVRELKKYEFTRVSKSALATRITFKQFSADLNTACFIAYYTARCNLRSVFTNTKQDRPYDQIADALFKRCARHGNAKWLTIAHVYPDEAVLKHLTNDQRGRLMGTWFNMLKDIAGMLEGIWVGSGIEKKSMIVRRGNDSDTWNKIAGAWNKARVNWMFLLYSLGMEEFLQRICPGKVMRLMAADVAYWHRASGGDLDPNTAIWAALPLPWDVLNDRVECTRGMVEDVCLKYKMDPVKSGWIGMKPKTVEEYRPTQELVHGVAVASPELAKIIRKAGWFSGKGIKDTEIDAVVERDKHGCAVGVS